jgi:hypothetical protein
MLQVIAPAAPSTAQLPPLDSRTMHELRVHQVGSDRIIAIRAALASVPGFTAASA